MRHVRFALTPAFALLIELILQGCVVLPIPHKGWYSPEISGKVVRVGSAKAVSGARVSLKPRTGEKAIESAVTDSEGHFLIEAQKRWYCVFVIPLMPVDFFHSYSTTFECDGYETYFERLSFLGPPPGWISCGLPPPPPKDIGEISLKALEKPR